MTKIIIMAKLILLFSFYSYGNIIEGIDLRDNAKVKIEISNDNIYVYYFLSSTCPCSQASFDHLNSLQRKFKKFKFIGFHSSRSVTKEEAHKYFIKFNIDFPILLDNELIYANKFKAVKTPHIFVYGKNQEVLFQGGATNSRNPLKASKFYLQDALISLDKGENPEIENAKTIGCYIQR